MYTWTRDGLGGVSVPTAKSGLPGGAVSVTMTIQGGQQGMFKGSGPGNQIPSLVYDYAVTSPRDAASGMATGKRQHGAVTIVKMIDAATPQIFHALVHNEPLTSVLLSFQRPTAHGTAEVFFTVALSQAAVAGIRHLHPGRTGLGHDGLPMEEVQFVFSTIAIEHQPGKTAAMDSWVRRGP